MANSKPRMPGGMKRLLDNKLFECPVCFAIPEKEIYQCKNGHSTCGPCATSVDQCPQCREPWGDGDNNGKIRNLSMEAVIAEMEVGCKNKEHGCRVRVLRKELTAHLESHCKFVPIQLCKILGFTSCDFLSTPQEDIYGHIVEQHQVPKEELRKSKKGLFSLQTSLRWEGFMEPCKENRVNPLAVEYKGSRLPTLICLYNNVEQGDLSVFCLYFGHDDDDDEHRPPQCDVRIEVLAVEKVTTNFHKMIPIHGACNVGWSWNGPAISYKKIKDTLRGPPFKISIPFLKELVGKDEELALEVTFL